MAPRICPDCGQYDTACQGSHIAVTLTEDICINGVLYRAGSTRLMPAPAAQNVAADIPATDSGGMQAQPTGGTSAGTLGASSTDSTVATQATTDAGQNP